MIKEEAGGMFLKFLGIKVPETGKNGRGVLRLAARCWVGTARVEVGSARAGVGIGQPGEGLFFTISPQLWGTLWKTGFKLGVSRHFHSFFVIL